MQITHMQKEFEDFQTKKLGECHGLYVESSTLLLVDVFNNFRNMCRETYRLLLILFLYQD